MPGPTAALLHRVGPLLHGAGWRNPLARDLGMGERAMERWAAGEAEPRDPDRLRADLLRLVEARGEALAEAAGWLRGGGGEA